MQFNKIHKQHKFNTEVEIKKNQIEILEQKTTMYEMQKNVIQNISSRLDQAEERISEDRQFWIIQPGKTKKKEWKEVKKAYMNYTILLREQSTHY